MFLEKSSEDTKLAQMKNVHMIEKTLFKQKVKVAQIRSFSLYVTQMYHQCVSVNSKTHIESD